MPSGSDKGIFDIGLTHPQGGHPLGELLCLFWVHGKRGHGRSLVDQIEILKEGHPPRPLQAPNYPGRLAKNLYSFRPFAIIKNPCALSFNG